MAAKPKTIKVKISDGVKASAGGGAGSAAPGIKPTRHDGGGGGQVPPQESKPPEVEKKQSQLAAYQQRAAAAQQQYQQQKEAGIREAREAKERVSQKTTTGVYEKGGAVIRETKGDYQTLQKLKAQQPGSALVQTASGEYVLIKSTGLNLGQESTLAKVNENIQREGGTPYYPTERKLPSGGTLYMGRLADRVTTSEPEPPKEGGPVITQSDFLIDTSRPTKYTAKVGEGSVLVEQGALYQVGLSDTLGPGTPKQYQKTRLLSAREQAELISRGEATPFFIGYKDRPAIAREEQALLEQGVEGEVFPITYTTEEGKEIVTITGKSEGAEFNIYKPGQAISVTLTPTEEVKQQPTGKNIVQQAEEKSPLYNLIGEYGKGSRESFKSVGKGLYQIGAEVGLMFVPPEISGIEDPKKREELRSKLEAAYPKELQPKETPLTNLLAGKPPITPYGVKYDIGASAADVILLTGVPQLRLAKIKSVFTAVKSVFTKEPKPTVREPLAEYTPQRLPVSKFPETFPEGEFVEFKTQRIPLGKGLTKQPSIQATKPIKPVELERGYAPQRLPVSKFPETYGISKTGYEETKIRLGTGIVKYPPSRFTETQLQLGKGEIKRPGKDFTKETVGLGVGAVKTPPRVIGKTEGPPQPIKEEYGYTPSRLPVSRFPKTLPKGELAGYRETRISLGKGIIRFPKEGGLTAKRFTGPKPPAKPSPEVESKISRGLLLLMEKPQERKTFTSTKIALGTSDKLLQIRGGKVISDTLTKQKAKPSSDTFFIPQSRSTITEQTTRYPPSSKLIFPKSISLLRSSGEQTSIVKQISQKTTLKEIPLTSLSITPRQTQRQKKKEKYGFPTRFPTRQTPRLDQPLRQRPIEKQIIEEIPPPKPPRVKLLLPELPREKPKKRKEPTEPKSAFSWKGNVPEFQIEGVYKKYDIIYGEKRIAKLLKEERFGKPKRKAKKQYDILGFPKTKKAKSSKWAF